MITDLLIWSMAILNIFGTILNIKVDYRAFVIWTVCNVFWLAYDFYSKQYARIIVDIVNLATSTWGLIEWYKNYQKQKN